MDDLADDVGFRGHSGSHISGAIRTVIDPEADLSHLIMPLFLWC